MRKNALVLTTSAAILAYGAIAASAQGPDAQTPSGQQTAPIPLSPSGVVPNVQPLPLPQPPSTAAPLLQPPSAAAPLLQPSSGGYPRGMMGPGHDQYDGRRGAMGPNMMGSMMIRMMFALMDADGDGKLSLQEFQAAHERIFKAMDANKDGFVTLQEMQNFMRGTSTPFPLPQE
jgi:EF hand